MDRIKVLFVCTGNICRSPAAEGIFRKMVHDRGLDKQFYIDSAGTHSYHEGELPDRRMREVAGLRGYDLGSRSRPIIDKDFSDFDYIIYMDDYNRESLERKAPDESARKKLHNMTDYCMNCLIDHVPDPYYGGHQGFENVVNILEDACLGLLIQLGVADS